MARRLRGIKLLGNELPMPAKECSGRNDADNIVNALAKEFALF